MKVFFYGSNQGNYLLYKWSGENHVLMRKVLLPLLQLKTYFPYLSFRRTFERLRLIVLCLFSYTFRIS